MDEPQWTAMHVEDKKVARLFTVLVCMAAAACAARVEDEPATGDAESADSEISTRDTGPTPRDASPGDASQEVSMGDSGPAAEPDADLPVVWCWLVPDPRCKTGEGIIRGC